MDARWSAEYLRRKELMRNLEVPRLSEAKVVAGLPLALVLFEESHGDLQEDFGLAPYLEGPRGELWVSPSDLLIGKVALKPPLTQKHIQALTHQGIIDIGAEIEQKFVNEMRLEKEKAVQERENYLMKLFEVQKATLTAELLEKEQLKYEQQMEDKRLCYENRISQLLWECYEQVKQLEEQMQIEFDSLNVLWQARLEQEIQQTVDRITGEFLEKLRLQEQILVNIFTKQINTLKMKKKCAIDFERIKCTEIILQMKHQLQCQNVANLMYLLCKERRKCKGEKNAIENDYLSQIRMHKRTIRKKTNEVAKLTRIKNKKTRQLNVRERCLIEILRQFQKFIYFALKAVPTQGEFLLNIDKLIKFELDDYCISKHATEKKIPKTGSQEMALAGKDFFQDYNMEVEDYFETSQPSLDEECEHSDALPAFYFNDKMYIREDFRDMFSAGIEINKNNRLWNPDVEELLNIFRKSIENKRNPWQIDRVKSHHSSVRFSRENSSSESLSHQILTVSPDASPPQTPSVLQSPKTSKSPIIPQLTKQSQSPISQQTQDHSSTMSNSVNRRSSLDDDEEREIRKVSLGGSFSNDYKDTKKDKKTRKPAKNANGRLSLKSQDEFGFKPEMRKNSMTQSRLTLARDSVILHISTLERKSLQIISKMAEETASKGSTGVEKEKKGAEDEITEMFCETKGEESQPTGSINPFDSQESLEMEESTSEIRATPTTSKLLLANDSYELIKSTIAIVGEKENYRGEKRKSQLTFNPQVAVEGPAFEVVSTKTSKKHKQIKDGSKKTSLKSPTRPVAKIVGSRKTKEHEKAIDEFTDERIKSLVNVMKENPSLIRLFTPCFK